MVYLFLSATCSLASSPCHHGVDSKSHLLFFVSVRFLFFFLFGSFAALSCHFFCVLPIPSSPSYFLSMVNVFLCARCSLASTLCHDGVDSKSPLLCSVSARFLFVFFFGNIRERKDRLHPEPRSGGVRPRCGASGWRRLKEAGVCCALRNPLHGTFHRLLMSTEALENYLSHLDIPPQWLRNNSSKQKTSQTWFSWFVKSTN